MAETRPHGSVSGTPGRQVFTIAVAATPPMVLRDKPGMAIAPITPHGTAFAHATRVTNVTGWLFVSGQVGADDNYENPPTTFKEQARLAWKNVDCRRQAGGFKLTDIAKVTTYLADRKHRGDNFDVRCEVLGSHRPAITIIAADIYDHAWLLEVEVIAARLAAAIAHWCADALHAALSARLALLDASSPSGPENERPSIAATIGQRNRPQLS